MSFDTPNGTRGARQPNSGPILRWVNTMATKRIRRKGGKLMGFSALVLTTTGRKSGIKRTTPVAWFPGPDNSWLIVASAGGAAKNPAWYYNLAARPDEVQIEMADRRVAVTADQLHGAQRAEAWKQITAASSRFAKYQEHTDREIPVIRLTQLSSS